MESNLQTLLKDFRKRNTGYDKSLLSAPPISKGFLAWLNGEFPREEFMANDPLIPQKLLIREGIEMVLRRLSTLNNQQEKGTRDVRSEDHPNRLIKKHNEKTILKRDT